MIIKKLLLFFVGMVLIFTISCGGDSGDTGEDYGNLLDSEGGLTLTQSEHEIGWGKSECSACHHLENIHLENRTGVAIDIDAIREDVLERGVESCVNCHGSNGVD